MTEISAETIKTLGNFKMCYIFCTVDVKEADKH